MNYSFFLLLLLSLATISCQNSFSYIIQRVFLRESDPHSVAQNLTSQFVHYYDTACQTKIPTLLNYSTLSFDSSTPIAQDTTPQQASFCDAFPISIFAYAYGVEDQDPGTFSCSDQTNQECTFLSVESQQQNGHIVGGYWSGISSSTVGVVGNQIAPLGTSDSSDYVSISTYTASEQVSGSDDFIGQTSSNKSVDITYCPGTNMISSNFIFVSEACIASPLIGNNNTRVSIISRTSIVQLKYSWQIFANYKAFYASCRPDNGLIIHACEDVDCMNCTLLTDKVGCVNYQPTSVLMSRSRTFEEPIGGQQFFVNFQGCGLGRAAAAQQN